MADDFPKEVDEVRKDLQPVLKGARQEKKPAFVNVEKLVIERKIYRDAKRNGSHFMVDSWKAEIQLFETR